MTADPLDRVRQICLSLPEVTERLSHGEPTWFAGGRRAFVMYAERHHDSRVAFWGAAPEGGQGALVAQDPEHFFVPPYVGARGWLGVYLDVPAVDWGHIEQIADDAYRRVATKRLVLLLDQARLDWTP